MHNYCLTLAMNNTCSLPQDSGVVSVIKLLFAPALENGIKRSLYDIYIDIKIDRYTDRNIDSKIIYIDRKSEIIRNCGRDDRERNVKRKK